MHGELLRLAGVLAAEASGRPRWVARSRAVSTAYYALFHALAELCARELVGVRRAAEQYRHVYRSLDHSHARRVLDAVRREASSGDDLRVIADVFVEAQQDRHRADYDPGYRVTAGETAIIVDGVRAAILLLARLPPAERKLLAARLIGRARA